MSEQQGVQPNEGAGDDSGVSIEAFMNIELRVGKVMVCERIPKSKKLLRMEVDLGGETRQVLGGFAPFYLPEELLGRRVVVVANLKPAKLMGLESQGMILAASPDYPGAVPTPIAVPEGMPLGARVR